MFNSFILLTWIILFLNYDFINDYSLLIPMIFISYFLSIFPDIDSTKSNIRNFFALIIALIFLIYLTFNSVVNSLKLFLASFVFLYILFRGFPTKHRGITHNLGFSIFLSFVLTVISWLVFNFSINVFIVYFSFVLSGYLSHIILDKL